MGMTIRAGKPDPYQVRKEVDNYENTSLFDNMFINGKSVESRKRRRERRRELAQQKKQDTNLQKTSDMTKKAPKIASLANNSENTKQAALIKLATIRLAINYILRNRGMNKQAYGGNMPMQQPMPTSRTSIPRSNMNLGRSTMTASDWDNKYPEVESTIRTPYQMNIWRNKGLSDQQIDAYVKRQTLKRMQSRYGARPGSNPAQPSTVTNSGANTVRGNQMQQPIGGVVDSSPVAITPIPTTGSSVKVPPPSQPGRVRGQLRDYNTVVNSLRARSFQDLRRSIGQMAKNTEGNGIWDKNTGRYNFEPGDWDAYQNERDRIERGWAQMNEAERAQHQKSYDMHINALDAWREMQDMYGDSAPDTNYNVDSIPDSLPGIPENAGLPGGGWQAAGGSAPFVPQDMPTLEPIQYASPTYDPADDIPGDYDAMRNEFIESAPAGEVYNWGPNVGAPINPEADIYRGAPQHPGLG